MTKEQWIKDNFYLIEKCFSKFVLQHGIKPSERMDYQTEANVTFLRLADDLAPKEKVMKEIEQSLLVTHEWLSKTKEIKTQHNRFWV